MTPTINVNLTKCDCPPMDSYTMTSRKGAHFPDCPGYHFLIPCHIQRPVTFDVALGECFGCGMSQSRTRDGLVRHDSHCPARPIRVSCSIGGESWPHSFAQDVAIVEGEPIHDLVRLDAIMRTVRERWALIKALVMGIRVEGPPRHVKGLMDQRDTVFAALADMARAETAAMQAQQRVDDAFPYHRFHRVGGGDHRAIPPSHARLEAYVEFLREQVGVMP
jgi:hypothetical protein